MRRLTLFVIKSVHTAAFFAIAGAILAVFVDGVRGRPTRRTAGAAAVALAECAVYAGNGFVCPLTPLAERFGAERGSVTDLFLPEIVARNLAWIATPILIAGLALNARALAGRPSRSRVSARWRRRGPAPRRRHAQPQRRTRPRSPGRR